MTHVQETLKTPAIGVGVARTPEGLSAIHDPACGAAIWQRSPLPGFQAWIDSLDSKQLPEARVILPSRDVNQTVREICQLGGMPDCLERDILVDDASALAAVFSDIVSTSHLRMRFDVVSTNACSKFHIDAVTARLICTYRGSGTQYGLSVDGGDPENVFSVPTGSAMLMRGTLWPEHPKSGLLHRSPPIAGSGETRLLFVLDPVTTPDGEPHQRQMH